MKQRTCPNCEYLLDNFDNFFCSNCGFELTDDLVSIPKGTKIREYNNSVPILNFSKNKHIDNKFIKNDKIDNQSSLTEKTKNLHIRTFNEKMLRVFVFIMGVLLIFFVGLNIYHRQNAVDPNFKSQSEQTFKNNYVFEFDGFFQNFDNFSAVEYAPAESVLYIDIADFGAFYKRFLTPDNLKISPTQFAQMTSLLRSSTATIFYYKFEEKIYWVGVLNSSDYIAIENRLRTLREVPFTYSKIGEKLVFFQQDAPRTLKNYINGVVGGINLNISQNAEFVTQTSNLNPQGQLRVVVLNTQESGIIIDNILKNYVSKQVKDKLKIKKFNESFTITK